jgi:hypothetical protein
MILTTAVKQAKHLLDCFYPQIHPDKCRSGHTDMGLPTECSEHSENKGNFIIVSQAKV